MKPAETYVPETALPSLRMADLKRAERTRRDLAKWQDHMRIMEAHHEREAAATAAQEARRIADKAAAKLALVPVRRTRKAKP